MARHYSTYYSTTLGWGAIPTPAIDMTSSRRFFGSSGSFVSGGAYVRRSSHGARVINAAWNNMSTNDINRLLILEEAGDFAWDNPMAHRNIATPWLAQHTRTIESNLGISNYSVSGYWLNAPNTVSGVSDPEFEIVSNYYSGYPYSIPNQTFCLSYDFSSASGKLMSFIVPPNSDVYGWAVGESSGNARLHTSSGEIAMNTPNGSDDLPTDYWTRSTDDSPTSFNLQVAGTGTLKLNSVQIRIVPKGESIGLLEYSPGLGSSDLSFTEDGLQLVQHSAALDMQSATATWMETGWWK